MLRMTRRLLLSAVTGSLMVFSLQAHADTVAKVRSCNNAFVITLSSGTLLQVWINDPVGINEDNFNHMYATALELLASQHQIGYYYIDNNTPSNACGYTTTYQISILEATNN